MIPSSYGQRGIGTLIEDKTGDRGGVECDTHGRQDPAFVCQHLAEGGKTDALGFYQAAIDLENREWGDLNAWCAACEEVLEKEGDWNDRSEAFAQVKMICQRCFAESKAAQLRLDPTQVDTDSELSSRRDDDFWDRADHFIQQANDMVADSAVPDVGRSFAYAVARFNAFEAVARAKDPEGDRDVIIENYSARFRKMFTENFDDYVENREDYFGDDEQGDPQDRDGEKGD